MIWAQELSRRVKIYMYKDPSQITLYYAFHFSYMYYSLTLQKQL